jgi:endogenous inhibitor of DNA gyrase (YacG/DUF329 family)
VPAVPHRPNRITEVFTCESCKSIDVRHWNAGCALVITFRVRGRAAEEQKINRGLDST